MQQAVETLKDQIIVSFAGELASFTHLGTCSFFKKYEGNIAFKSSPHIHAVFQSVMLGQSTYGVIALESSSHGTIHRALDALAQAQGTLFIVGEIGQLEEHCLCTKSDFASRDTNISQIYCHPHIMECCSDYLDALDSRRTSLSLPAVQRVPVWDSAAACICVASHSDPNSAAIGSKQAAELHNLKLTVRGIGNDENAEVRDVLC